jgi:hypothetical protein
MSAQTISAFAGEEYDITIISGDDQVLSFTVSNGAVPYDLASITSLKIYLQTSVGASASYNTNCTVTAGTLGEFGVTIAQANWSGIGYYYVNLVDSSNLTTTLVYGQVNTISP